MRKVVFFPAILILIVNVFLFGAAERLFPAFPSAEGFGAFTTGGRGGKIYIVTTLEDYDSRRNQTPISGSFRKAVEAEGPRIVVFRVSGTIEGKCDFNIINPYITIAGQTSPGGICISNLDINTHDVVVRFMRIRSPDFGDVAGGVAQNIMIDHCSLSWGSDEVISFKEYSDNITLQWNLIAFGPQPHSMGSIVDGISGFSLHHNLYAHLDKRVPRICGKPGFVQDIRNNVIYDFGKEPMYPGTPGIFVNIVGNYYKEGSSTPTIPQKSGYVRGRPILLIDKLKAYITGNYYYGREDLSSDNWKMVNPHIYDVVGKYDPRAYDTMTTEDVQQSVNKCRDEVIKKIKTDKEIPCAYVNTDTAEIAYEKVLAGVGAYLPTRDSIDKQVVEDVRDGTGVIIDRSQVGKYPQLAETAQPPSDMDRDGMSDDWETLNKLNPNNPNDANKDNDSDGFTNIEEYLNFLAQDTYPDGTNLNGQFIWVYPPTISSKDDMYYGRPTGLKDWLKCYSDFTLALPVKFIGSTTASLESPDRNAEIRYTLDDSEPNGSSKLYKNPIKITKSCILKAKSFKNGRISWTIFKRFIAGTPQKAQSIGINKLQKGLICKSVKMSRKWAAEEVVGTSSACVPDFLPTQKNISIVYEGYIKVSADGVYKFNFVYPGGKRNGNDYCAVKIDGQTILCTQTHVVYNVIDTVALRHGLHKIEVIYGGMENNPVEFYWQGPGINEQKTPADIFFCNRIAL